MSNFLEKFIKEELNNLDNNLERKEIYNYIEKSLSENLGLDKIPKKTLSLINRILKVELKKPVKNNKINIEQILNESKNTNKWWVNNNHNKIIITDRITNMSCECVLDINNDLLIINKEKIGYCVEWRDENNLIPSKYKNKNNIVLHPHTNQPLSKFIINKDKKFYHNLENNIYYELSYNRKNDVFEMTKEISIM